MASQKTNDTRFAKEIISSHRKGKGYKNISKVLLISKSKVARVIKNFKSDGTATFAQTSRTGRPKKLTPQQEHLVRRTVEENQNASSLQIFRDVQSATGETVSRGTICSTL